MRIAILLSFLLVILTGCGGAEYAPVYTAGINAAGENVTDISGYVKDASISKESLVHATLQTMFKEYTKAHKNSGFEMDFEMVEIEGISMLLPKHVSYSREPDFEGLQRPPTEPSQHPVWNSVDNVVDKGLWLGLGWIFGDALKDMNSGTHYENSNFDNSFNASQGGDQLFNIDSPNSCPSGDCFEEECWMPDDPTCSCESRAAGGANL